MGVVHIKTHARYRGEWPEFEDPMDRKEQHHQHHQKEREHRIHEQKLEAEGKEKKDWLPFHPGWLVALGVILILASMSIWTFFIW